MRHGRTRESESFYKPGAPKMAKFSDIVQKDMNIANQVSQRNTANTSILSFLSFVYIILDLCT